MTDRLAPREQQVVHTGLRRRAVQLAWITVAYNLVEAIVSLVAGAAADSTALIGFGFDAAIELSSATIVLWQFRSPLPEEREHLALRAIAVSFFVLAAWVGVAGLIDLIAQNRPDTSMLGIAIAALSLAVMPVIAYQKRYVGRRLGAAAVVADSHQTWLCTALSAVLLLGLGANAIAGWWWADPIAAIVIAAFAAREGRNAWRGDNCCDVVVPGADACCDA